MSYLRFGAMIATSTAVMFGLMYLNTYALDHVRFSETRLYMAFVMGATMAAIMLGFMMGMYKNKLANIAIFAASAVVFACWSSALLLPLPLSSWALSVPAAPAMACAFEAPSALAVKLTAPSAVMFLCVVAVALSSTAVVLKILGDRHEREARRLQPRVDAINAHAERLQSLSEDELKAQTDKLRGIIRERTQSIEDDIERLKEDRRGAEHAADRERISGNIADLHVGKQPPLARLRDSHRQRRQRRARPVAHTIVSTRHHRLADAPHGRHQADRAAALGG